MSDYDTFVRFLELKSPLDYSVEGRLRFESRSTDAEGEQSKEGKSGASPSLSSLSSSSAALWIVLLEATLLRFFVL